MRMVIERLSISVRAALSRCAGACCIAGMLLAAFAPAGQPAALPPGVAMRLDTSDLASLERTMMLFTNAMLPNSGAAGNSIDIDRAFRVVQRSGQLPSLVNPLIQQFFGLPGVEMDPGRGIAMALFSPEGDGEKNAPLIFAAWLPVRSFAALFRGVGEGRREWAHIRPLPKHPAILSVAYNRYGAGTLYMAASPGGAVLSTTLWGLERARRFWPSGPGDVGASGFGVVMTLDFLQPGAEPGLAALLEGPAAALSRRMGREGGKLLGDVTLYGMLHAMRQGKGLEFRLVANPGGDVSITIELAAKPGGELAAFLADSANRSLDGRYLAAMPEYLSIALALAGGPGTRDFVAGLLREARAGTKDRRDTLTRRVDDILQSIQVLNTASAGAIAAGIALGGCGMAVFDAGDPATATGVVERLGGLPEVEMRARGRDVVTAVGFNAAPHADAAAAALADRNWEGKARPGIARLLSSLEGKGVVAFVCYPSEMVRLILSYQAREAYYSGTNGKDGTPLDMFAASYLGTLLRSLDGMEPSRHPLTIAADAPDRETLRIRAGFSAPLLSEITATYQRVILTFLPGGSSLTGGK